MSVSRSPILARWLAGMLVPPREREFVLGDLEELYALRCERDGASPARRRYWRDALSLLTRRVHGPVAGAETGAAGDRAAADEQGGRGSGRRAGPPRPRLSGRRSLVRELVVDVKDAVRGLRRHPAFHALAVGTLALGIGSTAAVFGMADQLLLRPLAGTTDPQDAAYLGFHSASETGVFRSRSLSLPDVQALQRGATALTGLASYGHASFQVAVGDGRPIRVNAQTVYGDFFGVLGVHSAAGRVFRPEDTELGANPLVAVISQAFATRLFGGATDGVGRTLRVNGHPVTVIGVAGGGFAGPERGDAVEMWVPLPALVPLLGFTTERLTSRESVMQSDFVLRMRKGVSPAAAEAQIASVLQRQPDLSQKHLDYLTDAKPTVFPGLNVAPLSRERTYGALRLMAGIVALVLLIACANVANLLLFRNVTRRGALATRRAVGASRGRITRQRLVESMLLAVLGAVAGLGVAWPITLVFRGETLARMPAFEGFPVDWRVLAFAGAVVLLTTVLFGAIPAMLAGRFDLSGALKAAGGRDTGRVAGLRRVMSGVQVALSLTLLVGALLLGRTIHNLYTMDTGMSIDGVATLSLYNNAWSDAAVQQQAVQAAVRAVEQLPSVTRVALDLYGPHGSNFMGRIGLPASAPKDAIMVTAWPVTPDWFGLLRVRMLEGRPFRQAAGPMDGPEGVNPAGPGVVLSASLARRLFGDTRAVGRTVAVTLWHRQDLQVVGVTNDIRSAFSPDQPEDAFFIPFGSIRLSTFNLLIRTRTFDAHVARSIREAVEAALPGQAVDDPAPLTDRLDQIYSERRIFSRLLTLLSALAVLLAAVGLYGVIAFTVAGRTREFGIRLALGAEAARIARLVLRDAVGIVLFGTALGLLGAWGLSTLLQSRLFGVARLDPLSYGAAVALFAAVAGLACWTPARAAMRVDPVETLKSE